MEDKKVESAAVTAQNGLVDNGVSLNFPSLAQFPEQLQDEQMESDTRTLYRCILASLSANNFAKPKLFRQNTYSSSSYSDQRRLIERFIIPNSILEGTLVSVKTSERNPRKMHSLKVRLTGFRALAHSGKQLYQPYKRHSYLYDNGGFRGKDPVSISEFREFSKELQAASKALFEGSLPLIGYIDESRHIYDAGMPHFSCQVDRLLDPGSNKRLLVLVRDVDIPNSSSKPPLISLTLLNSRLQGSK